MKFAFNISGAGEIEDMLAQLPATSMNRVAVPAMRAGGKIIRDEARRLAPKGDRESLGGKNRPGQLRRAIKLVVRRTRQKNVRRVVVLVSSIEAGINPHWIEYGTAPIRKAKGGFLYFQIGGKLIRKKSVRGVSKRPFMRPAADNNASRVRDTIAAELGPAIRREAERLARRQAARVASQGSRP